MHLVTYRRCRWNVNSFNYYCYVILAETVTNQDISDTCDAFGGLLMWFSDDAEIQWLTTVLHAYSIDCIHLGTAVINSVNMSGLFHTALLPSSYEMIQWTCMYVHFIVTLVVQPKVCSVILITKSTKHK